MPRVNRELRRRAFELAMQGDSAPEIARKLGVSVRTAYRILADPITLSLPPRTPRKVADALRLAYEAAPAVVEALARLAADPNIDPQVRATAGAALMPLILQAVKALEAGYGRIGPSDLPY